MRTGAAAIAWGREQIANPVKDFHNLCLQFVRMCYGIAAVHPSAGAAWEAAKFKHPTTDPNTIPRGVPVFWATPSPYEHIAISLGGGLCLSTDAKRYGRVDIVRISSISSAWNARLLGWTEDLNGVRVWQNKPAAPPAPPAPVRNNVTRAREQLRVARRCIAIAERYLNEAPDEREVVHNVADQLDKLDAAIERRLDKLPKR